MAKKLYLRQGTVFRKIEKPNHCVPSAYSFSCTMYILKAFVLWKTYSCW